MLMGCASDRVSYEASQFEQGLVTYALLKGMKGAALRENRYVDVGKLLHFAEDEVPTLARGIGGVQQPRVMSKQAISFDIGMLGDEERRQIALSSARPFLLRPALQNADKKFDDLHLTGLLAHELSADAEAGSRGRGRSAVYVDAEDLPGAIRPAGQYVVDGNSIKVTLVLVRDDVPLKTIEVTGAADDKPGLIRRLIEAIQAAIPGQ